MLSKKYAVMLATGVSVLAMGISAPAVAGPNPNNFGGHLQSNTPTTLTGSDNAPYTATILIDAGYNHPGGSSVTGSVTGTGSFAHPTAIATVTGALATSAVNFGAFVQRAVISKTALATGTGDITLHLNVAASTESRPAAVISVGAHAQASATTLDNSAYAAAHINAGVDQFGAPVGQLSGYIANSGTIDVHADATAYGSLSGGGSFAGASIGSGIVQHSTGVNTTNDAFSLTNANTIDINARASATAFQPSATEVSYGVGGGYHASAYAGAFASGYVNAGIVQIGLGNNPSADLANSGLIHVGAQATAAASSGYAWTHANATDDALAYSYTGAKAVAGVGVGIVQEVLQTESGGSVSLTLNNDLTGTINIDAHAQAVATLGSALAHAGGFDNVPVGSEETTVHASHALATAINGATALAGINNGILQQALGNGTISLTNSGQINIHAMGSAVAHTAYASASAYGYSRNDVQVFAGARAQAYIGSGISQGLAAGSATENGVSVTLSNIGDGTPNVGVIDINARAFAGANNGTASGYAEFASSAYGTVSADAYASAVIHQGIAQQAIGSVPTVTLTNSGEISIRALGTATDYTNKAFAGGIFNGWSEQQAVAGAVGLASIDAGIVQSAVAGTSAPFQATVSLTNEVTGGIFIDSTGNAYGSGQIIATAYAFGGAAYATASAGLFASGHVGVGIGQTAVGPQASATLTNSGVIGVFAGANANQHGFGFEHAYATAYGNIVDANALSGSFATANVGTGILQNASVTVDGSFAYADINNALGGRIGVTAYAHAYATNAHASAYAFGGGTGNFSSANAEAGATASASIDTGIKQSAFGGISGIANVTNSGHISVIAGATASGSTNNYARAVATGNNAQASAHAGATAYASVGKGIDQSASGEGAAANLENSGVITIAADARAHAFEARAVAIADGNGRANAQAGAVANASIDHGIAQFVTGSSTLSANLYNYGSLAPLAQVDPLVPPAHLGQINVTAYAYAHANVGTASAYANGGAGGGTAYAKATAAAGAYIGAGITQYASSSGLAAAYLYNSGLISVQASAVADGTAMIANADANSGNRAGALASAGGTATAYIGVGIDQRAAGGNAFVDLYNDGTISIVAAAQGNSYDFALAHAHATEATIGTATAYAGGNAKAYISEGIYQYRSSDGTVEAGESTVTLTNDHTIVIAAQATAYSNQARATANVVAHTGYAHAAAGAFARASVGSGIYQEGYLGTPNLELTNSGEIDILALAKATSYGAQATAYVAQTTSGRGRAYATAGAGANAYIGYGIDQYSSGGVAETLTLTNNASSLINIHAAATANAYDPQAFSFNYANQINENLASAGAFANASIEDGIYQSAESGTAAVALNNYGTISVAANATADVHGLALAHAFGAFGSAFVGGSAYAHIGYGIYQSADASDGVAGSADATITNQAGLIQILSTANAQAVQQARAIARVGDGIYQEGYAAGSYTTVTGTSETATTNYYYHAADMALTNSGTIQVIAAADAVANSAYAAAYIGDGIYQYAYSGSGDASVSVTNTKAIAVRALATAVGTSYAIASGRIYSGVYQSAEASSAASVSFANNGVAGVFSVHATANAVAHTTEGGIGGNANAYATVGTEGGAALYQNADGFDSTVSLTNSGTINIGALATATAVDGYAVAQAVVNNGIYQHAYGTEAGSVSVVNSKTIGVFADALANGATASAYAAAHGVEQVVEAPGGLATFNNTNTGTFLVGAHAVANGTVTSDAVAGAYGLHVHGETSGRQALGIDITNANVFTVQAKATADVANAHAIGIYASNVGTAHNSTDWISLDTLTGTVTNSGAFTVSAAISHPVSMAGVHPNQLNNVAYATGMAFYSSINDVTVNNSGTILVSAEGPEGTLVRAKGIVLTNYTGSNGYSNPIIPVATGDSADVFTLNNKGGTIMARQSTDGGATWQHGTAIDAADAPNNVVINLDGKLPSGASHNGLIYGDIKLSTSETYSSTINVANGETKFDGVINPGFGGVTYDVNGNPSALASTGPGTLNILSGGTLYLVNQDYNVVTTAGVSHLVPNTYYDGPAGANVNTFSVASGGTLALELHATPNGGFAPAGSFPTITADTVNLAEGSTLQIRPSSWNGLYGNSYTFQGVIVSTNTINGTFTHITTETGTPLLQFGTVYVPDPLNEPGYLNLSAIRVHFGAVNGLTDNQSSVGGGLEGGYSPTLTGPAATLFDALFTQDKPTYENSLNQLSGEQYAGYLQSLNSLTGRFNGLISSVTDCPDYKASIDPTCQRTGKTRVWAQFNQGRTVKKDDAFSGLGGYGANQTFLAFGADYKVSDPSVLGLTAAYVRDDLNFNRFGGRIKSDGFQIGAYATYDVGRYYAKAVVNYSALTAHSTRSVNIVNMQDVPQNGVPGAVTPTQSGNITGFLASNPKADVISAYGEVGYRFGYAKLGITPYVALEYTDAKLKAFTETGVTAADLAVTDSSQSRATGVLGLRIGGTMGKVTPELNAGWRHQFGSKYATVNASFADLPGSAYSVQSAYEKADTAFVDLGLSAVLGKNVVGKIGYQGRFNGDNNSNSGTATLIVSFGGFGK